MGFAYRSGDVSYWNGPTPQVDGMQTCFVCTARLNQGGFQVTTYADQQTAWVARKLGHTSFYIFNGPLDAYTAGVLFATQALMRYGDQSGILIDCEDEPATGTASWGPGEAMQFMRGVQSVAPYIRNEQFIVYMNYTVNRRYDWSACVAAGMGLMYARPGGPDDFLWWPVGLKAYMKQDGEVPPGTDADWHNTPWPEIIAPATADAEPDAPEGAEQEESAMLSIIQANDDGANPPVRWAVHGPGYWRVITDQNTANGAAARFGNAPAVWWSEWDEAYAAAVSSGFKPREGQTSRSTSPADDKAAA